MLQIINILPVGEGKLGLLPPRLQILRHALFDSELIMK